jgi:hypothetical protein
MRHPQAPLPICVVHKTGSSYRWGRLRGEPHLPPLTACWSGTALFELFELRLIRPCHPPLALGMPAGFTPAALPPAMQRRVRDPQRMRQVRQPPLMLRYGNDSRLCPAAHNRDYVIAMRDWETTIFLGKHERPEAMRENTCSSALLASGWQPFTVSHVSAGRCFPSERRGAAFVGATV